jgi:hypothetical protein
MSGAVAACELASGAGKEKGRKKRRNIEAVIGWGGRLNDMFGGSEKQIGVCAEFCRAVRALVTRWFEHASRERIDRL